MLRMSWCHFGRLKADCDNGQSLPRERVVIIAVIALTLVFIPVLGLDRSAVFADENRLQSSTKEKSSPGIDLNTAEEKVREFQRRFSQAEEAAIDEQAAQQLGVTLLEMQERAVKVRDTKAVYERVLTALKKQTTLAKEEVLLREKMASQEQVRISQDPPYSLSFYDNLLDQLATTEQKKGIINLAKNFALKAMEDAKVGLVEGQQTLRKLREKKEGGAAGLESARQNWELELAQLEQELTQAVFDLQKVTIQNLDMEAQVVDLQMDIAQKNAEWSRKHLHFDKADMDRQIENLERNRTEMQKRLKDQMQTQTRVEASWLLAQERVETVKREPEITLAKVALKASETWREASQRVLEHTEDSIQLISRQEQAWRYRYALLKGEVSADQMDTWWKELKTRKENLDRAVRLQESYQSSLQAQIAALEKQISEQGAEKRLQPELQNQMRALRTISDSNFEYLSTLLASARVDQRFLEEIEDKRAHFDLAKELQALESKLRRVWDFELWVIDDRGVTVKKVVIALFILVIGFLFVKIAFRIITGRFLPRSHLGETTAVAVGKILNYLAILLLILFALRIVNIPLTVFAFLGGAIAIGVGFGAQNLINNFISGFIIMAEQPIKIGDLVEVEGNFARVEDIGARCTKISTGANVQILVPNSMFLEKSIINWTLSDREVRAYVTAGVVYGSPVREVERLMLQAVREHKKVHKAPEPFVLFDDFGDNALIFQIHFWISMSRLTERRMIESAIRFRIDELFREAGIVIAFPQRDVHLDTQKPLELRIVDAEGGSESRED